MRARVCVCVRERERKRERREGIVKNNLQAETASKSEQRKSFNAKPRLRGHSNARVVNEWGKSNPITSNKMHTDCVQKAESPLLLNNNEQQKTTLQLQSFTKIHPAIFYGLAVIAGVLRLLKGQRRNGVLRKDQPWQHFASKVGTGNFLRGSKLSAQWVVVEEPSR